MATFAATSLGYALQPSNGAYHPEALTFLLLGLSALSATVWSAGLEWVGLGRGRVLLGLFGLALAFQFAQLLSKPPGVYLLLRSADGHRPFFVGLGFAAVLVGGLLAPHPFLGRLHLPTILAVHAALGMWLLKASPNPFIDVFIFHRDALHALLNGQSPYEITYPNIYGHSQYYGAELIAPDGRLNFGFLYPPLSLLLALPGHLLAGDYRYGLLFAMTGTGALIAYARPSRFSALAAALFLFTPRHLFVLEQGWTEPFAVLLLAAVAFCAVRAPGLLPYAAGLFVVVKQYVFLGAAALLLSALRPRNGPLRENPATYCAKIPRRRFWVRGAAIAGVVGAAVSLPLALWTPRGFLHSVVAAQFYQPFRSDALSLPAAIVRMGGPQVPSAVAFIVAAVALSLCWWRAPRQVAGGAWSFALVLGLFFASSKQAFCNYYFLVVSAVCIGLGTMVLPGNLGSEGLDPGVGRRESKR